MPIDLPGLALAGGIGFVVGWVDHVISGAEHGRLWSIVLGVMGAMASDYFFAPLPTRLSIDDPIVATLLLAAVGAVTVLTVAGFIRRS